MYAKVLRMPKGVGRYSPGMMRFKGKVGKVMKPADTRGDLKIAFPEDEGWDGWFFRSKDVKIAKTKKELMEVKDGKEKREIKRGVKKGIKKHNTRTGKKGAKGSSQKD